MNAVHTSFIFLSFPLMPFFPGTDFIQQMTENLVGMSSQTPLGYKWQFLRFSSFQWPWQFWRVLIRSFIEYILAGICLMFFSWSDWRNVFSGGRHRSKMPFSRHQGYMMGVCYAYLDVYEGYILSMWFTTWLMFTLITWFVLGTTSLRTEYYINHLEFIYTEYSLICLFMKSFISINKMYLFMDMLFIHWLIMKC